MATGTKAYIEDKDGNNILPATDWSIVQNKPTNLATTDQLPTLGPWQRDGIVYKNGAYDWDHVNNGMNCAYRIADLGGFKLVEVRLAFGVSQDITSDTEVINLPKIAQSGWNEETWDATGVRGVFVHITSDSSIHVYCQQVGEGDKYSHDTLLTWHRMYFSTI